MNHSKCTLTSTRPTGRRERPGSVIEDPTALAE
jgi:hypothetical protein